MVPLQDDPEPAATKRGRGRPKRVLISEEPDYKEHDEASSPVPQPDTEDQPVSVWASSLCSSHAGLQVAAAPPPIKRGRGRPKKAASSDNEPAPTATKKP